jgi:sulfane dehydrogenase subunit SoxC
MECAGNGRSLMTPVPSGTAWALGAVSTGVFGGTSLRNVLEACGVAAAAVEIVFEAADSGVVEGGETVRFTRSLPLEKALHPDTLLAWSLNGEPLAPEHGFPLRLFVPGWYGVASVKWLTGIDAVAEPFTGHFQTDRYVYEDDADYADGEPVTRTHVRSLITRPATGAVVRLNGSQPISLGGVAWSGFGAIVAVEVSDDGGAGWSPARLGSTSSDYAARGWTYDWLPGRGPGEYEVMARATDATGRTQPLEPVWNRLGYSNNVVHRVALSVVA